MGLFQKVGEWLTDRSERLGRRDSGAGNSYYASSEAEQAYGSMQAEPYEEAPTAWEPGAETQRMQPFGQYDQNGRDYGGRVPYQSQQDAEMMRQRMLQEEQARQYHQSRSVPPPMPQGYPAQGYSQPPQGYPQQPAYGMPQQQVTPMTPPNAAQGVPPSNVVQFPGPTQGQDGAAYAHTEYVVLLRSYSECRNIIEYIKTNASVFLNMEFIASDSERQRCVDMLSGAAYTLGCKLTRVSARGIYLISSPTVHLVMDAAMEKFAAAPETAAYARAGYEAYGAARPYGSYQAGGYARPAQEQEQQAAAQFAQENRQYVAQGGQAAARGYMQNNESAGGYSQADTEIAEDEQARRYANSAYRQ